MAPALALLLLAAGVMEIAAELDACPAAGLAAVSPCAVAPTCTVSAFHVGFYHSCALFSHGGVR